MDDTHFRLDFKTCCCCCCRLFILEGGRTVGWTWPGLDEPRGERLLIQPVGFFSRLSKKHLAVCSFSLSLFSLPCVCVCDLKTTFFAAVFFPHNWNGGGGGSGGGTLSKLTQEKKIDTDDDDDSCRYYVYVFTRCIIVEASLHYSAGEQSSAQCSH